jgi:hypothetical protein
MPGRVSAFPAAAVVPGEFFLAMTPAPGHHIPYVYDMWWPGDFLFVHWRS